MMGENRMRDFTQAMTDYLNKEASVIANLDKDLRW